MKKMKKYFALFVALAMVLGMSVMSFGADLPTGTKGEDKTITITPPSNVDAAASNTYTVYKVFNATTDGTNISYKSLDGAAPDGFVVDDANNVYLGTTTDTATGNAGEIEIKVGGAKKYIVPSTADELTDDQIAAISAYTGKVSVGTVTITGPTETTVTVPDYGYYYITTTSGTVVTIDSTHKNAEVKDKNTVPEVDKTITGATSIDEDGKKALAQVGTVVNYSAEITIGNGAEGYIFHDTMEPGLTYKEDAAVTGVTAGPNTYTVSKEGTDTFTITFNDNYIKTLNVGAKLTVTYSATVNDNAVTVDPLKNTAYLNYGDKNSNNKTPVTEADVYEAKFTVTKKDGKDQPLKDAGFVLKNADGKYYKLTTTTTGEGNEAVTTNAVTWVDDIEQATEYTSDAQGAVPAFTGLANGTYTLVEKTVPSGYNKAADETFNIAEHNYESSNLEQGTTVVNNSGAELPSTGGIGTTIFYVLGTILVLAAGVLLVTRRRMRHSEE